MTQKVLLTGGSGFIGSRVYADLVDSGYDVLSLDKNSPSNPVQKHQVCDILDRAGLTNLVSSFKPTTVLHLAARTDLAETQNINGYRANIQGVENVIAAIRATPSVRRCIYTSSQLVCHVQYKPKNDTDYAPINLYGESKVQTEKAVRSSDGGGVIWCLVRPTTIWGPGMNSHYQRFLLMIKNGRYFHVGRRPIFKTYGYVGNAAYQFRRLIEVPAEAIHQKTFYLADYKPLSLRDWTSGFQLAFGAPPIRTIPESLARVCARMGDLINACGYRTFPFNSFRLNNVLAESGFSTGPIESVCGPLPYTMKQGIEETAAWFNKIH